MRLGAPQEISRQRQSDALRSSQEVEAATLDNMHARVGLSFPDLMPPSFRCTDVTADSLTFHYYSSRDGLTDLVVGLVRGLGRLFALDVSITVAARKGEGSDHDVFHIRYAER